MITPTRCCLWRLSTEVVAAMATDARGSSGRAPFRVCGHGAGSCPCRSGSPWHPSHFSCGVLMLHKGHHAARRLVASSDIRVTNEGPARGHRGEVSCRQGTERHGAARHSSAGNHTVRHSAAAGARPVSVLHFQASAGASLARIYACLNSMHVTIYNKHLYIGTCATAAQVLSRAWCNAMHATACVAVIAHSPQVLR